MLVEYKVGDLYLTNYLHHGILKEVEITDVCQKPPFIKTCHGWEKAEDFHKRVLCKLGHYELKGFWIFKKKVFIKEN